MKKVTFAALAALTITACSSGPKFQVNGDISGADGKMLYLEASGLEGIVPLDSVKLKGEGTFSFKQPRPESPEFYRLRIDDKIINFSVDSIETIQIKAPYVDFSTTYTVEGSENSNKIKELTLKQIRLQKEVDDLLAALRSNRMGHDVFEDSLATLLNNYKEDVKVNYIFAAPNTAAAYFALFQKLNNYLIFDPLNNKDDVKCFAAVATSLNNAFPHAVRSKNLYNIVIKGMKNTRQPQAKALEIPQEKIVETGLTAADHRSGGITPMQSALLLFILVTAATIYGIRHRKTLWGLDLILFFCAGIAGCILAFLALFSQHPAVSPNYLLFVFHPLHLFCLPWMINKVRKRQKSWYMMANCAVLTLFILLWAIIPQRFDLAVLPLALCLLVRSASNLILTSKKR